MIANETFTHGLHGDIDDDSFGAWTYFKYMIFDWLSFFSLQPANWKFCKRLNDSRVESSYLLDIVVLQKRVLYL
jgi:hypothetical protein